MDGLYHVLLYAEVISLRQETLIPVDEPNVYKTELRRDNLVQLREDKAHFTMTPNALQNLFDLLYDRFGFRPSTDATNADKG